MTAFIDFIGAFAQFGLGALFGVLLSTLLRYLDARIDLAHAVLTEAERDALVTTRRRRLLSGDKVLPVIVVLVMVAMLFAGLSWIRAGQSAAEQDRVNCLRARETSQALRERTRNYIDEARAEKVLWRDLHRFIELAGAPKSLLASIDRYQARQAENLNHLKANPYPKAESC